MVPNQKRLFNTPFPQISPLQPLLAKTSHKPSLGSEKLCFNTIQMYSIQNTIETKTRWQSSTDSIKDQPIGEDQHQRRYDMRRRRPDGRNCAIRISTHHRL